MEAFNDLSFIATDCMNEGSYGRALFHWGQHSRQYTANSSHWQHENSNSADSERPGAQDSEPYLKAVLGFSIALLIYFCFLCHVFGTQRDASKREVDRSIIKKSVLAHGQSQLFRCEDKDCDTDDEDVPRNTCCHLCLSSRCCCRRKQKQTITPAPDSAEEILESYRHHMCEHCNSIRSNNIKCESEKEQTRTHGEDELVLAEEGSSMDDDELMCPICLEPFHVGEQVAWSRMGNCRHVFHYECILPWAVLGNVRCPVCRELFWSRKIMEPCILCHNKGLKKQSEMKQSRFCVRHGLVTPQEALINDGDNS